MRLQPRLWRRPQATGWRRELDMGPTMPTNRSTFDVTTPDGLADIAALRERFVEDPTTDLAPLRPAIARSWRRSAGMGVDPNASPTAVDEDARVDEQTLKCAAPFVEELEAIAR